MTSEYDDFELLGFRVRLKAEEGDSQGAANIVESVKAQADILREQAPHLSSGEIAILVALHFASEKDKLERDFATSVRKWESSVGKLMERVENIRPSAT